MNPDPTPASDPLAEFRLPPDPEAPASIAAYPRHAWQVFRLKRRLSAVLVTLDERLKAAVVERDEALALLGEATLTEAGGAGTRISAFARTLAGLDADRIEVDGRREALAIELAGLEADRRARLSEYDARIGGLDAELIPLERSMVEHQARLEALELATTDAADLVASLGARLEALGDAAEDDAERAEERASITRRLAEIEAEAPGRAAALAALEAPTTRLQQSVDDLRSRREAMGTERTTWLAEVDARIAETTQSRDEEQAALARLDGRRRAALVDLGREALRSDDRPVDAAGGARAALDRIVALRRARTEIQTRQAELDERPLRRVLAAVALVSVLIWFLLAR